MDPMNVLLLLLLFGIFLLIAAHLTRLVVHDGLGSNPPPRSHRAELGTWVDQELRR
ncbi:MAG: hypothetical protein JWR55_2832 [Aeromicrobium sp.]|jgi:hypothetical protein|nr:hypothetical protein [Aeromicrobium sp.]